ncbi:hypothetical protein ZIOFF_020807 [Zingiber officinale]|uniref:Uncharacterized protein n=1 Tax=Zingiber officinale TaxID=94328 RepID=A0A8J5H8L6_ZINOF|nr:hypothetical protein ZIOFF_020807 [Zingiber officinale]
MEFIAYARSPTQYPLSRPLAIRLTTLSESTQLPAWHSRPLGIAIATHSTLTLQPLARAYDDDAAKRGDPFLRFLLSSLATSPLSADLRSRVRRLATHRAPVLPHTTLSPSPTSKPPSSIKPPSPCYHSGACEWVMVIGLAFAFFFFGIGSFIQKQQTERCSCPVQLSKFLGRDNEDGVRRSAISGKKVLLKLDKSKEDKMAESNRNELLKFLNASYD